jgi:hypothetical protein
MKNDRIRRREFIRDAALGVAGLATALVDAQATDVKERKAPERKPKAVFLIYHPMWLIIKEDSVCAERTPPWGAPNEEAYSGRVSRNLRALEDNSRVKMGYDFSAAELEDIHQDYPDLARRIRHAIKRGQLRLVNGTYSQPHLHTLSLEANIREFVAGRQTIRDLFDFDVRAYVMQEPGYADQTPQILKALGYDFSTRGSGFPQNLHYIKRDSRAALKYFRGLDGTNTELFWPTNDEGEVPPINSPDMEELDVKDDTEYLDLEEYVKRSRGKRTGRESIVVPYIPWSYLEGTNAEALSRANTETETALIQAETLEALSSAWSSKPAQDMTSLWKVWLKCHHHDAYWSGGPELRQKSIGWLAETKAKAMEISGQRMQEFAATQLATAPGHPDQMQPALVIFPIYPKRHQGVLRVDWEGPVPAAFVDAAGREIAVQPLEIKGGSNKQLTFAFDFKGAGVTGLVPVTKAPALFTPESLSRDATDLLSNRTFTARLNRDGSIRELRLSNGSTLITESECPGGQLSVAVGDFIEDFRNHVTNARVVRGPLFDLLEASGQMAEVPIVRRTFVYHNLPLIEMEIEATFDKTSLAEFKDDAKKLCAWWPKPAAIGIVHGIAGGAIKPHEPETAFFAVNWMDLGSEAGGLAIANFGTLKSFVREGRVGNVLAWGASGDKFNNRAMDGWWLKVIDLRLNGRQLYRFALYPHAGSWQAADVPSWAMSVSRPPLVFVPTAGQPFKRVGRTFLAIEDREIVPTAVLPASPSGDNHRGVTVRFYESTGSATAARMRIRADGKMTQPPLFNLGGKKVPALRPWLIGMTKVAL